MTQNRRIILASRPVGMPTSKNLPIETQTLGEPADGQILVKVIYLSLDPYMRGRMNAGRSYAANVAEGDVMVGGAAGRVVASKSPKFKEGDYVFGMFGWQEYYLGDAAGVRKLDPAQAPISTSLGVLGMPGMTAYVGLLDKGQPKEGETVVVSAASGAVGGVVGQIAKIKGCRAVGIAGGPEKCAYVVDELGFDACVDYKAPDFLEAFKAAVPKGVDVYFENVGGRVADAVFSRMNDFGRVALCGLIAHYNDTGAPEGPDNLPRFMFNLLSRRLSVNGFIVSDHPDRAGDFFRDVSGWIRDGQLRYREDIVEGGLDATVEAFQGLLTGRNFGKLIVKISEDTSRAG
ncbi:MAG: NADP-dependent oxidoreductase [Tistrella sp.]|uniref:NADP-dependent oxidoreductase n=1 Tax=Tistrella mobilis TaxID=171437 RepID=A0A3B9IFA5_9PROT|nr:NADP-dependent oxidoreductase [Tistrella sp.]MAD37117.1 NADP-dependent oxidoreductase [Tistrella sp.]MBA74582.1 NADP-dependent oxidoreductase [Tistrella sp.]HAE45967.1 NADP-dependent oxidoreductase [Tistrella mobilis]